MLSWSSSCRLPLTPRPASGWRYAVVASIYFFFHVNLKNIFVSNIPIKEDDPDLPDYDSALKSESQRRRQELEK